VGVGVGGRAPTPQPPIPNPQSPNIVYKKYILKKNKFFKNYLKIII
jgi:hypothetical protein